MGELQAEYGDRVAFNIVPAEETMRSQAAIDEFGFTAQKHGLVVFSSAGEPVVKLAGRPPDPLAAARLDGRGPART